MAPFAQKRMLAHLKPGIGRPSEYREEYCTMVRQYMAQGFSLTAFAGEIGMSRDTVYEWMSRHAAFADAVSRGRAGRANWLEGKLLRSRKGAETTAAIFALKNAAPDEWKDVKYQEHAHVHASLRELTDAELLRIIGAAGQVGDIDGDVIDGESVRVQQPNER
jgi:transposase